jgi:hypothetical protein
LRGGEIRGLGRIAGEVVKLSDHGAFALRGTRP